ncbi:MAG TPA: DUF2690 domain-containing protein [Umezawaea sp.]|jgi:hypothetical protein|nr:DUF2690 domain-containing protein [Umezawaea sp.]
MIKKLLLALAVAVPLVGVAGAGGASAAPWHYGTDPAGTGCNSNAAQIASRNISTPAGNVTVQVFYSYSCSTNWIRVTGNPGGGWTDKWISADGGAELYETDYGYGSSYSMQVYAPGATCVNFRVQLVDTAGGYYGGTGYERVC